MSIAAPPIPAVGQVVRCRGRAWLVDGIEPSPHGTVLALSCLEDDSQGEQARVIWEAELGTSIIDEEAWRSIGSKNGARAFDDTRFFFAFYRTLRWNCVTATDPKLFQSPFRAGIRVEPYQLEPLRKALLLPRVNLFIADDVLARLLALNASRAKAERLAGLTAHTRRDDANDSDADTGDGDDDQDGQDGGETTPSGDDETEARSTRTPKRVKKSSKRASKKSAPRPLLPDDGE